MRGKIPHLGLIAVFVLLSMSDLYLTRRLIDDSGGHFYESNPIANWWLTHYGWPGLFCYKIGLVVFIVTCGLALAHVRPKTSGRFLAFACVAVSIVVLYSCGLAWSQESGWGPFAEEKKVYDRSAELDQKINHLQLRLQERLVSINP